MENTKNKTNTNNLIFTYSAIEQKRHEIAGPGKCLMIFLCIFPFVPLFLAFFSGFIRRIEEGTYKMCLYLSFFLIIAAILVYMFLWIKNIFYVLIIDENGCLYRLRISNFWYKIKNQTYLLNPLETTTGRMFRLFYMVGNIKKALENISDTVTYEELIAMGQLEKFESISEVAIKKKKIVFHAQVKSQKGIKNSVVRISRMYENDSQLIRYLNNEDYKQAEKVSKILEDIKQADTMVKKIIRFTVKWTCIMAWAAVVLCSQDLSRYNQVKSGEYLVEASEYGKMYKPVLVIYFSVEIIYLINKGTDALIVELKKNKE